MWWLGFRQIKVKTTNGIVNSPGSAVVCGPYQSEAEAQRERMRGLKTEWDAAYSQPFQADDAAMAGNVVESMAPVEQENP
jgi:hypothetical protein